MPTRRIPAITALLVLTTMGTRDEELGRLPPRMRGITFQGKRAGV
jgi:hypothetical protein